MKRHPLLLLSLIIFGFFAFSAHRCNVNNEPPAQPVPMERFVGESRSDSSGGRAVRLLANEAAIEAAFTLDFRPQRAEPESEAITLSAAALAGAAAQGTGLGNIVGGGLRRLSDYRIVYYEPARARARIEEIRAAQEAWRDDAQPLPANNEPLTVIDWGPQGLFSSAVQRPSIHVIFSQPMIPIASLGEQSAVSPVVTIYPPVRGTFRWYGTSFLSFEGEEPLQSQQTYTITVAANATSMSGAVISGERVFTFHTEALRMRGIVPGEEFRRTTNFRFDNNNVPPEAARQISITFNYPVHAADISQYLEITALPQGGSRIQKRFTLRQEDEFNVIAELSDPVNFDTQISVTLTRGARSRGATLGTAADQTLSFRTPGPFRVTGHDRWPGHGRFSNIVEIRFSHALHEATVQNAMSIEPFIAIDSDNFEVRGNIVRIFNLPVDFGDRFTINVAPSVEDVFNRRLTEPFSAAIVMPDEPPPRGEVRFLDWRQHVMLEAQFPPRYLFEYRNITPNSRYRLTARNNPWNTSWADVPGIDLTGMTPNTRYFEEIDLSPFLNEQGRGFVSFRSDIEALISDRQRDGTFRTGTRRIDQTFNIQVTDLGLTVRFGFNRAVILVTSLSTGQPVEGATVRLLPPSAVRGGEDLSAISNFGEAVTGRNGLAVINMGAEVLRRNTEARNRWDRFEPPFVFAEKDGDRAIFNPSSHNIWRFGVHSALPQLAEEIIPVAFMFSDRGLYRPGETLTFRGVDRSRVFGMYTIYHGDYTVTLEENRWQGQQIAVISGTTSESGGFYGSIVLPEDITPGSYRLVYRRNDGLGDEIITSIPITIAFFERLVFQASLSAPAQPVIMGDDINLNLQASYLAGGSLSGATWESAWFEQITGFHPGRVDTRGFVFGPRRAWDSSRHISSGSGVLSGQGTASISQGTGGSRITGAPYLFRTEVRVTDISNQMISAFRSVMVHPANFYIGLRRENRGFVRAGQEVTFDYITVNVQGERVSGNALFLQSGAGAGQMRVELIREEWRRVQQRGVSGVIHDEFSRELVTDSVQNITIRSDGSIRVRPSAAGFHILRVSAQDREGRTALTEHTFYVTGTGGFWNMSNPSEIRLTPDREMYEPGDIAQILMQSALPAGWYLITVEREGIFSEEVRHFTEPVTVIEIPIARNFVPIVYVSVSSYSVRSGPPTHEYGTPDLDRPTGYFGVTPLRVNPRTRAFSVQIESENTIYRPGEEVTMTLTATRGGRPLPNAELTLMVVDRGVLDLINYRVPDPISHFYANHHFPLSVAGGDSRAWLMDPVTFNVRNLAGGDAAAESKLEERTDFNPTAVFEPMLITDENGRVTTTFRLPDNLTTYRVTVFGVYGDLFALQESEIAAQNRINVRQVIPRRLRERDTGEVGILITNLDSVSHTLTVRLDIGPPLPSDEATGRIKIPGQAFVDGVAERRVTVRSGENAVVYFDVGAVREGIVGLNFTINSNVLNERLVQELQIERPFVFETFTTIGTIRGDTHAEGLVIPSFADHGVGSLSVILDATRLGLLDSAVTFLFRNPFGSLEQRSGAIMPLLVFGEYIESFGLRSEVADPRRVVENELRSWGQLQLSNGGFPFWPSQTNANFFVSLRIAHAIAIAQSQNITIPASLNIPALRAYLEREYQNTQRWQRVSRSFNYQSYLQSYMLYVMALLGERVDPARLAEILTRDNVDASVLAFVGMTYRILGREAEAAAAAQRLRNLMRMTARGVDITDPFAGNRWNFFGCRIEQLALSLQFFAEQFPGDDINTRLLFSLLENKRAGSGFWVSTAVTVRVLSAVDALIRAEDLVNLDVSGSVSLAGTELLQGTFRGLGARPITGTFNFNDTVLANLARDRLHHINFTRSGTHNLYYTVSLRYAIPSELQSSRDEGLGVFMNIIDINTGEEIRKNADGIMALQSGVTYRARVRLSSTRDRTFVALRVPIPSGAEILDATFVTTATFDDRGGAGGDDVEWRPGSSWISHQAIMDNEVQYFWDRFNRGETTVSFLFRTTRRGVYPTPPVQAELMYEPEVFGRTQGVLFTIE